MYWRFLSSLVQRLKVEGERWWREKTGKFLIELSMSLQV